MIKGKKVFIVGLDCAAPELVFDKWFDELPNMKRLAEKGMYGKLKSTTPPITVPAWTSMMTSKEPGELGFYGFRNRAKYTYTDLSYATASLVKDDTVWDILSRSGKKVVLIGVPQTYPPKPVNGSMVSCFLTPSTKSQYTYPPELKAEIEEAVGEYILDVKDFRTDDKDYLIRQIYEMTDKRFEVVRHMMRNKEWDFFMFVEMGIDRIHHGMWKYFDRDHPKYEPSPYENAVRDYYKHIDTRLGELLSMLDEDTVVLVVSDHGAKRMDGGICVNEWLIKEGYLKLLEYPDKTIPFSSARVDWANTTAWGEGGYYARIFMNVKGREPQGLVDPAEYEEVRNRLMKGLSSIPDDKGRDIGTRVFRPEDVYKKCNGIPPDLIVYFGDLYWRSVGSIGLKTIHTFENDTGPDDANHSEYGIFIMSGPDVAVKGRVEDLKLIDVAPTVLDIMGMPVPEDMTGKAVAPQNTYSDDEEEEVRKRLEALGYVE